MEKNHTTKNKGPYGEQPEAIKNSKKRELREKGRGKKGPKDRTEKIGEASGPRIVNHKKARGMKVLGGVES